MAFLFSKKWSQSCHNCHIATRNFG